MKKISLFFAIVLSTTVFSQTIRREITDWKFSRIDNAGASSVNFDDSKWENVTVPHDWAITCPFDKTVDMQVVKIEQNNEKDATVKTGRTGSLPFIGVGWYRTVLSLPANQINKQYTLSFDGAMSNAQVYVNGQKVGNRPYGYSYFYFDVTPFLKSNAENVIAVRLENQSFSSRWYPGAGLYRKVELITKNTDCFKQWAHFITTPIVESGIAKVKILSKVQGENLSVKAVIKNADGLVVSQGSSEVCFGDEFEQNLMVKNPQLWSPETPYLYTAELQLYSENVLKDTEVMRFGIRTIKYSPEKGFELNGKVTKFRGVCLHHDQGPIGTAVNKAALRRQLTILKDLGCNAIRSSHNMPSMEQLELCDEMGFMFLAESFDEWKKPKVPNGYNLYFDEWAEKDIENLVRATRNHPCIVMWSSGNEVPDQWGEEGVKRAKWLQNIFHREDPTRPVTVGMDQVEAVMANGFGALMDVPGLNYRANLYDEAYAKFPQGFLLGSETASTLSSRGIYKFPVQMQIDKKYPDNQCSSYDVEYCNWSNIPDLDFEKQDDRPWVIGEFVWTGFDYLGEPTPYDNYWPARSSYFGMCDLAGLPKDRYYLYRSKWNPTKETLHVLPHWTWPGREGEVTPVFVYTNYKSAELFVNGKSQGVQHKSKDTKLSRYRLTWMDVKYEPGTIKVVAFDNAGKAVAEQTVVTAGKPYAIKLDADRSKISADGNDLCYVTATIVDKAGNTCPTATNQLKFSVTGSGKFRAACNGDATSLEQFNLPTMKTFSGKLVVTLQSVKTAGNMDLTVACAGLKSAKIKIETVQ